MPSSALPPGFKEQAAGTGTDWDNPIQRLWRKDWFAYGPRASQWWAKWREIPLVLWAAKGKGPWRFEYTDGTYPEYMTEHYQKKYQTWKQELHYLSAIQYWTKWHVAILWPLHIQFSYYLDDVPVYPEHAGNRRVIYIRVGARRDADKVYWFPSIFVGLQWN